MVEHPTRSFQWKSFGFFLLMYFALYFLPLAIVPGGALSDAKITKISHYIMVVWGIGGMLVIPTVASFISKGSKIREQVAAASGIFLLWSIATILKIWYFEATYKGPGTFHFPVGKAIIRISIVTLIFSLLAFGGAWWGGLIQRAGRKQKEQDPDPMN